MIQGFRDFITRGNVVDLAVGVVIGAAFSLVVTAFVDGIINPLVAGLVGKPSFDEVLAFQIGDGETAATIMPGLLITAVVNFLLVAAAIYFAVVVPINKLNERRTKGIEPEPEAPAEDVALLTEIRDLLAHTKI